MDQVIVQMTRDALSLGIKSTLVEAFVHKRLNHFGLKRIHESIHGLLQSASSQRVQEFTTTLSRDLCGSMGISFLFDCTLEYGAWPSPYVQHNRSTLKHETKEFYKQKRRSQNNKCAAPKAVAPGGSDSSMGVTQPHI